MNQYMDGRVTMARPRETNGLYRGPNRSGVLCCDWGSRRIEGDLGVGLSGQDEIGLVCWKCDTSEPLDIRSRRPIYSVRLLSLPVLYSWLQSDRPLFEKKKQDTNFLYIP